MTGQGLSETGSRVIESTAERMSRSGAGLVESGHGRGVVKLLYLVENDVDMADEVELND